MSLPTPPLLPVLPDDTSPSSTDPTPYNSLTAATAASARALSAQAIAFYFRAPAKAFFRTRVDYLSYARTLHAAHVAALSQRLREERKLRGDVAGARLRRVVDFLRVWAEGSTIGVLRGAVRREGWRGVLEGVGPPLLGNVTVGAVLYSSYLSILGHLHPGSAEGRQRVYPPPHWQDTFTAGFLAGSVQSLVAAPVDAVQARYEQSGRQESMWRFARSRMHEIGGRGIFAGWALSWMKDSFGAAVFFSVFEGVKGECYYDFVRWWYGDVEGGRLRDSKEDFRTVRPYYLIEPGFLMGAGLLASMGQQVVLYPLTNIQLIHWDRLEALDSHATTVHKLQHSQTATLESVNSDPKRGQMLRAAWAAYRETWAECKGKAAEEGKSVLRWAYRGFWGGSLRQVPSTSAGLIIFEVFRRKYGEGEKLRIQHEGVEILVS